MKANDIDVIIPIHNSSKTLNKCINSLLNQKFKSFNIILIDDGSTDDSPAICDYYKKFENVYAYHIKNNGIAYVRNYSLKISKSKYVMFVDSDDWVSENFIRDAFNFMQVSHNDIGIFGYYIVSKNNQVKIANPSYYAEQKMQIKKEDAFKGLLDDTIGSYTWNKIYKRKIFEGIEYPVGHNFEDLATMYKIFDKARSIGILNKNLYYYFQRDDSIMHSLSTRSIDESLKARIALENYIKANYPKLINISHGKLVFNALQYVIYSYREQAELNCNSFNQASKILREKHDNSLLDWKSQLMIFLFNHNRRLFKLIAIKTGKG